MESEEAGHERVPRSTEARRTNNAPSRRWLDEFDATGQTRRASKSPITRHQRRVEHLRECHIDGVVGGQIVSKRPDAAQKRLVRVPLKSQSLQVFKSVCGGIAVDLTIFLI